MANFDFWTYCNTFWMISGTAKKSTKSGPPDPAFITNIFQKIQEKYGNILGKTLSLSIWDSKIICSKQCMS